MSRRNIKPEPPSPAPKARTRSLGRWAVLNILAGIAGLVAFTVAVNFNKSYHWLWYTYTRNNINSIKHDMGASLQERMKNRLGVDYEYVLMVQKLTPENAVLYYPSREDFMAAPPTGPRVPFRGTMVDKLAAVRVLYPRKVVMESELGKTPYADRITHIAVVNSRNRDMVDYPTDTLAPIDVLPVDGRYYVPY